MSGEISNFAAGMVGSSPDFMWSETIYNAGSVALPLVDPPISTIFPPSLLFLLSNAGNTLLRM
jgi:hypothetical protein